MDREFHRVWTRACSVFHLNIFLISLLGALASLALIHILVAHLGYGLKASHDMYLTMLILIFILIMIAVTVVEESIWKERKKNFPRCSSASRFCFENLHASRPHRWVRAFCLSSVTSERVCQLTWICHLPQSMALSSLLLFLPDTVSAHQMLLATLFQLVHEAQRTWTARKSLPEDDVEPCEMLMLADSLFFTYFKFHCKSHSIFCHTNLFRGFRVGDQVANCHIQRASGEECKIWFWPKLETDVKTSVNIASCSLFLEQRSIELGNVFECCPCCRLFAGNLPLLCLSKAIDGKAPAVEN